MPYPEAYKSPKIVVEMIKDIIRGKKVCELGCGEGDLLLEMSKYAREVLGVEKEHMWAEEAKNKGLKIIEGDFLEIPIPKADVYYVWVNRFLREKILARLRELNLNALVILGYNSIETPRPYDRHTDLIITVPLKEEKKPEFKISIVELKNLPRKKSVYLKIVDLLDRFILKIKGLKSKLKR